MILSYFLMEKRLEILKDIRILDYNEHIQKIAEKYMSIFNFPNRLLRDIFHVAYAVFYEIDYLLTWNCKHLANAHFTKQLEKFNIKLSLKTPEICTPEELVDLSY